MDIPVSTLLKEWQSYVTTISRNLMELSEQEDVKLIQFKVKDTVNGYTGLTRMKALKAADSLSALWRYYSIMSGVVDRAGILYSKDSFLNDTDRKVRELLECTSVILETEHIDIKDRSLLSPETHNTKVMLRELLEIMQKSFEDVKSTFKEISNAACNADIRLKALKDDITSINEIADTLKLKDIPKFNNAEVMKIESDPLQALVQIDGLSEEFAEYKDRVKYQEQAYQNCVNSLKRIKDMLDEMDDLAERCENRAAISQRLFGTVCSRNNTISSEILKSLKDWMNVLKDKLSEGSLNACCIGCRRLENECTEKLNALRQNFLSIESDYNEWMDLKGEFNALKAKLNDLRRSGITFDSFLDELIKDAEAALNNDLVDLENCRILILKLQSGLKTT